MVANRWKFIKNRDKKKKEDAPKREKIDVKDVKIDIENKTTTDSCENIPKKINIKTKTKKIVNVEKTLEKNVCEDKEILEKRLEKLTTELNKKNKELKTIKEKYVDINNLLNQVDKQKEEICLERYNINAKEEILYEKQKQNEGKERELQEKEELLNKQQQLITSMKRNNDDKKNELSELEKKLKVCEGEIVSKNKELIDKNKELEIQANLILVQQKDVDRKVEEFNKRDELIVTRELEINTSLVKYKKYIKINLIGIIVNVIAGSILLFNIFIK